MTPELLTDIRKDFPILRRRINGSPLVYFDNAATTQKPSQVIETVKRYYECNNGNIHRSPHTLGREATDLYVEAHANVAKFIGAREAEEIVFVRGCTEGINLVAHSFLQSRDSRLGFSSGDEIVLTVMEHHSNIVPWQMVRDQRGVVLRFVDIDEDGALDMVKLRESITENTKLVCCTHVSNILGTRTPVEEIARMAHGAGALLLVDGAQSVPHIPIDVREIDCDFLTFSGHKMMAPMGIGVLYGKKELLQRMSPFQYGGDMISDVSTDTATWNELPWKFEAGTQNVAGGIALGGAEDGRWNLRFRGSVDYLGDIGMEAIRAHEISLTERVLDGLSALPEVVVHGPTNAEKRQGIVAFNIKRDGEWADGHIVAHLLDDAGIAVRSGGHCAYPLIRRLGIPGAVRASFYIYNTADEVDYFLETLEEIIRYKLL